MVLNGSDYLFFHRDADFFVFDKKSAYLYPIDSLHYAIGAQLQEEYQRSGNILSAQYFVEHLIEHDASDVIEHYDFLSSLLSSNYSSIQYRGPISKQNILNSLAVIPHIVVEVTERCNFQCRYCFYGEMYTTLSRGERRAKNMSEEDCLKCLRVLLTIKNMQYSTTIAISFYGGEPLVNFNLIRNIVKFCKEEFPEVEFQFRMTTNGSLLKKYIRFLTEHDFHLLISLDGEETSNKHRRYKDDRPVFGDVYENILFVYQTYREFFINNIEFISVLHGDSDIISICEFFLNFGKTPLLTNLSQEGVIADKQTVFSYSGVSPKEMLALYNVNRNVYDIIEKASKSQLPIEIPDKLSFISCNSDVRGCFLFASKIFLAANGLIYLCEKSSRKFPFGSFQQGRLEFFVEEINRYYDKFKVTINNECSGCSLHHLCNRCFFEEPSLIISPIKCKLSDTEMKIRLLNSIKHE